MHTCVLIHEEKVFSSQVPIAVSVFEKVRALSRLGHVADSLCWGAGCWVGLLQCTRTAVSGWLGAAQHVKGSDTKGEGESMESMWSLAAGESFYSLPKTRV